MVNNPDFNKMTFNERLRYFTGFKIDHPYLSDATNELWNYIVDGDSNDKCDSEGQPKIIYVIGATGTGKTTLREKIYNNFLAYAIQDLKYQRHLIPILSSEAIAEGSSNFKWSDFYRRTLKELNQPLLNQMHSKESLKSANPYVKPEINREMLEDAYLGRKVIVHIIDEAQHICMGSSGKIESNIQALKSLANKSRVVFVLIGTYELLEMYNWNGQITRRSGKVEVKRYKIQGEGDEENFQAILYSFAERLPFVDKPDLLDDWEFFYERSIGCVGILKDWMNRTVRIALANGSISLSDFEKTAYSAKSCRKMLWEALTGEKKLQDTEEDLMILRAQLGLNKYQNESKNYDVTDKENKLPKKQKLAVGERKPVRDRVGGEIGDNTAI